MQLNRVVVITKDIATQDFARRYCEQLFLADSIKEALDICKTALPELIILDNQCYNFKPENILNNSDYQNLNLPVIIIANDDMLAEYENEFIKLPALGCLKGTNDYLKMEKILQNLNSSNNKTPSSDFFANKHAQTVQMVGKSPAAQNTLKMIEMVAKSQCNPVLVVGETGTGKEVTAKAIHNIRHPKENFVAINCAALTANLLESELFGHVKGSFTGADKDKTGLLEIAGNGSIFLDEISEMPLDLQAKLLRVLQEKTFRKVGGVKDLKCNATIIASSNRNLYKYAQENKFRQDLYYRLNVCPIKLSALRSPNRSQDIELLANYFVQNSTICPDKKGKINSITKIAIETLTNHNWPGNIRELKNVIDRAIILETTDKIGLDSIIIDTEQMQLSDEPVNLNADNLTDFSLSKAEKELIAKAMQQTSGQKTRAASLLGITRATLYAKLKQYDIKEYDNNTKAQPLEV